MLKPEVGDYVVFKTPEEILDGCIDNNSGIVITQFHLEFLIKNKNKKFKVIEIYGDKFKIDTCYYIKTYFMDQIKEIIKKEELKQEFKQEFKFGEKVLVRDDEDQEWKEAIFLTYRENNEYPYRCGINDEDESLDKNWMYRYAKKIEKTENLKPGDEVLAWDYDKRGKIVATFLSDYKCNDEDDLRYLVCTNKKTMNLVWFLNCEKI